MLEEKQIYYAVDLQHRTYRYLTCVREWIPDQHAPSIRSHDSMTPSEAMADWVRATTKSQSHDWRLCRGTPQEVNEFANMLASYLLVSFDLVAGNRLMGRWGCSCEICARLIPGPHLVSKKLTKADKHQASMLKEDYLRTLACNVECELKEHGLAEILSTPELDQAAALATYGVQLLRRMNGDIVGPEALALWREFAWLPTGSPKKNFELRAEDILAAEGRLKNYILNTKQQT